MILEEAWRLLGLEAGADEKAVRKAYLRLLKVHSPERDPEGFKRLRVALELAQGDAASAALDRTPFAEPSEAAPFLQPVATDSPDVALRARLLELESVEEREACARDAAAQSGSAVAYTLWIDVLAEDEREEEAAAVTREAVSRGHTSLVGMLRRRFGRSLTSAELASWLEQANLAHDADFQALAEVLISRGRVRDAVDVAVAGVEHVVREAELLPPELEAWCNRFGFAAFASNERDEAVRYISRYVALRDPASRVDPLSFGCLTDLVRVHAKLGKELVVCIAESYRDGDPARADAQMQYLRRWNVKEGLRVRRLLQAEAPVLANLFVHHLPKSWVSANAHILVGGAFVFLLFCTALQTYATKHGAVDATRGPQVSGAGAPNLLTLCDRGDAALCRAAESVNRATGCADFQRAADEFGVAFGRAVAGGLLHGDDHAVGNYVKQRAQACWRATQLPKAP